MPENAEVTKSFRLDRSWARGKTYYIILSKEHNNKMTSNDIWLPLPTDQCLSPTDQLLDVD